MPSMFDWSSMFSSPWEEGEQPTFLLSCLGPQSAGARHMNYFMPQCQGVQTGPRMHAACTVGREKEDDCVVLPHADSVMLRRTGERRPPRARSPCNGRPAYFKGKLPLASES